MERVVFEDGWRILDEWAGMERFELDFVVWEEEGLDGEAADRAVVMVDEAELVVVILDHGVQAAAR